jgi:chromosome segregation ATPase
MKNKILTVTFLCAVALVAGCDREKTAAQQIDKIQTETKAASQDMKDYTFAQKDEFVKQMQSQLTVVNEDLDKLSVKIESSSNTVKAEARPKLQALRDDVSKLNQQLDKAKNSTESTWDSVKEGTKKAYESVKESFQQSRQWVSDKIKP